MPLLQPPAEQPFSLIPPNSNPVSNDRVLLRLGVAQPAILRKSSHFSGQSYFQVSLPGDRGTGSAEHRNG
jgi:hypothetical protein